MDFNFPKKQRLSLKKDIDNLLEKGEVLFIYPFKVYYRVENGEIINRSMFSVPKKNFKRAVKRNLIRRRIKEAYRLNNNMLKEEIKMDILFVYISKEINEFDQINSRMQEVLVKLNRSVKEDNIISIHTPD
jgi:ribonuclease P protein component